MNRRNLVVGMALAAGGVALALAGLAAGPGAATARDGVTMRLPPITNDKIYGAPTARGRPIVVIDAGHGGSDPGAGTPAGDLREKDLTLAAARELRDVLVERGRVRVAMTRDSDIYVRLDQRSAVARRLNAALFVSLHIDSAANPLARGASVYSLSDVASDAESARLAALENRGSAESNSGRDPVGAMLTDLAMRAQMTASAGFASRLVAKASGRIDLRPQPHRFAAFHVLRRTGVPAVLFEAGYLSNAADERLLRDPDHRHAIVLTLAEAIESDVAVRSRHQAPYPTSRWHEKSLDASGL
ncbi:MAG: N-acetylmuramoyl-L-alanine amidase [Sphingomicrobium sp.]